MNGWQRLFVLLLLVVSLPLGVGWLFSKPEQDDSHYVVGCVDTMYVTPAEATRLLATGDYEQHPISSYNCKSELQEIATGVEYRERVSEWRSNFKIGLISIVIAFAAIYAIGFGIAWVWRGFFPKKPESSR